MVGDQLGGLQLNSETDQSERLATAAPEARTTAPRPMNASTRLEYPRQLPSRGPCALSWCTHSGARHQRTQDMCNSSRHLPVHDDSVHSFCCVERIRQMLVVFQLWSMPSGLEAAVLLFNHFAGLIVAALNSQIFWYPDDFKLSEFEGSGPRAQDIVTDFIMWLGFPVDFQKPQGLGAETNFLGNLERVSTSEGTEKFHMQPTSERIANIQAGVKTQVGLLACQSGCLALSSREAHALDFRHDRPLWRYDYATQPQ